MVRVTQMEFRATQEADPKESKSLGTLSGRAITFGKDSKNIGFIERVEERAFTDDVMAGEMFATFNHNKDMILGRTTNGTLRVEKRQDGVYVEIDIPNTSVGRDVAELAQRGDLGGFSFEFVADKSHDIWERRSDGTMHRTVNVIKRLYAFNPVVDPAYDDSSNISFRDTANAEREALEAEAKQANLDMEKAIDLALLGI